MKWLVPLTAFALASCRSHARPHPTAAPAPAVAGSSRVLQRGWDGGLLELDGDHAEAMKAAEREMASVCAYGHRITRETDWDRDGSPGWRVHYQCQPSPALSAAPAWVGRSLLTGVIRAEHTHRTFTLQRDGKQALLSVELREANPTGKDHYEPAWKLTSRRRYLASVEETGDKLVITGSDGDDAVVLYCRPERLDVAEAGALREQAKPGSVCAGDEGRWDPATTTSVQALRCYPSPDRASTELGSIKYGDSFADQLVVAPSPGIEWLHVNDDCSIQGGGWRAVPPDGSIEKIRAPALRAMTQ